MGSFATLQTSEARVGFHVFAVLHEKAFMLCASVDMFVVIAVTEADRHTPENSRNERTKHVLGEYDVWLGANEAFRGTQ